MMGSALPDLLPQMLSLADTLSEPRIFIGSDYRVLAANKAYRDQFGAPAQIAGRYCHELSHHSAVPCDQSGESCPLKLCQRTGEPCRALHIHHTPHGPEHVDVEIAPIKGHKGRILFFVETMNVVKRAHRQPAACGLVGCSPGFNRMLTLLKRVTASDSTVLLLGESGTGKELAAQALHEMSRRAKGPFVAVDCVSMTETLFGSELFGHEKGSFTGAIERKIGLVEAATGGTLFFDEIGDMPLCLQVKLLRLIESGIYRRVGGVEPLHADFRLVLATHRDVKSMVDSGSFRSDLYYRISTFPVAIPPLRERREDIPLLAESLLTRLGKQELHLHPDAMARLLGYDFPGNVRELRNLLERAALLTDGDIILPEHLPEEIGTENLALPTKKDDAIVPLAEAERRYLRWALEQNGADRRVLAGRLGLSERTLYRKLKEAQLGS